MEDEKILNFLDENGELLNKDEFLKNAEAIYDDIKETVESENEDNGFLAKISNPENQIDVDSTLNTYSFLDRVLYLTKEIEPDMGPQFYEMIKLYNRADEVDDIPIEERIPIVIVIDTPGGDLMATLSIIDCINMSKTPVWTVVTGTAYSGGFFIAINGHKRFGLENSSYLFHQGMCSYSSDAHKFSQHTKFYEKNLNKLKKMTLSKTGISEEEYEKYKEGDWWFTADEALRYNIIDKITKDFI